MKTHLSPRDLAQAIGVSESSIKRWANEGLIEVSRTAGGHRRILRAQAIRFVRLTNLPVVRPELLGFPEASATSALRADEQAAEQALYDALTKGDASTAQGLIHGPFLAGRPLAGLFDGLLGKALRRIGELWQCRRDGIFIEHRATDICLQAVMRIRLSLPAPPADAPSAVGGTAPGDLHLLAGQVVSVVLHDLGLRAVNLGSQTSLLILPQAAEAHRAALAWLSVTMGQAAEALLPDLAACASALQDLNTRLVVGGQANELLSSVRHANLTRGQDMAELAAFTHGLTGGAAPAAEKRQGGIAMQ